MLALTLCKDQPLDRLAFANPVEFLAKQGPAPQVSLESPTIARRHAHAYLLVSFLKARAAELHRPTNSRFFGMSRSLADAVSVGLRRNGNGWIVIPLRGVPAEWELDTWPITPVFERLGARDRQATVLVDADELVASDAVTRRQFVLWAQRARVVVRDCGPANVPDWLVSVVGGGETLAWTSAAKGAREIGDRWAAASEAPVVRGPIEAPAVGAVLDLETLLRSNAHEALVEIGPELDGPATGFGIRLRAALSKHSPELGRILEGRLLSLSYSDRYLFSPLTVRLVAELVAGFGATDANVSVTTLNARTTGRPHDGRSLHSDWSDQGIRAWVLRQVLAEIAPKSVVNLQHQMGHRRRLEFVTERGSGTVYFDQGVGSWKLQGRVPFDHLADAGQQIAALQSPFAIRNDVEGTYLAVRLNQA